MAHAPQASARARPAAARSLVAAGLLALGLVHLARALGSDLAAEWFYVGCWWSYILAADGLVHLRAGRSLLLSRPRALCLLALFSAAFWLAFELANLRLANWYYVGVPPDWLSRGPGVFLAFATVLPGILETHDLVATTRLFARARTRSRRVSERTLRALTAAGLLSLVLPLAFPTWFYPLIWGATVLLAEPWLYRRGERCLLGQLAAGDPRTALRLLAAGLACGLLWEAWNALATARWIYTVPFFEQAKLFEMPLAGFLGFPPFALECYSFARVLVALGLVPELERDLPPRAARPRRAAWAAAAALAFCVPVILAVNAYTVRGTRPRPGELASLTPEARQLVQVAGMGARGVRWLAAAGIESRAELARADADELFRHLASATGPAPRPSAAEVRVWIRKARHRLRGASSG